VSEEKEAAGTDVGGKATGAFLSRERHDLHAVAVGVVSPGKRTTPSVWLTSRSLEIATRWVYRPRYSRSCIGPANGRLAYTTQSCCRSSRSQVAKASGSAREASEPAKRSLPVMKAR